MRPRSEPVVVRLSLVIEAPAAGRLAGAETAKNGWWNGSTTTASPQSGLRTLASGRAVSDESGGVTCALLETHSGRRPQRNGSMCGHAAPTIGVALLLLPWRVGLVKLDDVRLTWYKGTGLAKADEGALNSCDDEQGLSTPADAPGDSLHSYHRNAL
jgi:hypothetical protein